MDFKTVLADKNLKAKQKVELLSQWILANAEQSDALLAFAQTAKDPEKGTCMEAFEFATRANPAAVGTANLFEFAVAALDEKAPRVKWESAKVVGNIARLHPQRLEKAIAHLLDNTAPGCGTVVRWSAAFALGEIVQLDTPHRADLLLLCAATCAEEQDNAIRKIYEKALKKASKQVSMSHA